jgi:glycosyltransferase involved in cell wall biosynthesis
MSTFDVDPELMRLSLASLRSQSWAEIEVIVVDDGSSAPNRAEIERLGAADPRVRFIGLPRNQGPYVGRNMGIAAARGAYIAIQDADDVSHPERLAYQVALLEAHPEAQATASEHLRVDQGARLQFQPGFGALADGTMSTLYRRAVFDRLGFFAPVRSRGDVEFRARIRQALGPEAYRETHCPLVVCLGDAGTLSQATKRDKTAALRVFRSNFSRRRWTGLGTIHPRPVGSLSIPESLRP